MKTIKRFKLNLFLLLFTAISICLISCEEEQTSSLIDLKLSLNSTAKTKTSRDFSPTSDELTISKFVVTLKGPDNQTSTFETIESSKILTNLVKGKYEISAIGYNGVNKPIVEGSGTYYLFNVNSTVNMTLNYISGQGNVALDFYWNENQVDPEYLGVLTTYHKLVGNNYVEVAVNDQTQYIAPGHGKVETPLDSGYYIVSVKLMSGPTELSGLAEQLIVLNNHTTVGTNTFIIGDKSVDYNISFNCNTYLPITGVIESTPASIIEGQNLTLTFTPSSIPGGHKESEITYKWYFEGTQIENENTNKLTILPKKGEHRYDLFAYINGESGTLGSARIVVSCQ